MSDYPSRCQHVKVNGVQCGSPALRRNRFCFFHKRFRDERIRLSADRARRSRGTFILPVLEDANSIQIALMEVMRLLLSNQIEHKTASLMLYALQTASSNLRNTSFNPQMHNVILDPRDAAITPLNYRAWEDDEFEEENEEEELDEVEAAVEQAKREAAVVARLQAQERIKVRERARQTEKDREALRKWSDEHPDQDECYLDADGRVAHRPRKPPVSATLAKTRANVVNAIHQNLPALTSAVVEAAREEEKQK